VDAATEPPHSWAAAGLPVETILALVDPEPGDRAGEDDATMLDIAELFRGAGGGDNTTLLERALLMTYRRHREHIWTEHAINHVKEALEGSGLEQRVPMPPAICFVDLTGFTQLTEASGRSACTPPAGPGRDPGRRDRACWYLLHML
jgi:hypothetical protein